MVKKIKVAIFLSEKLSNINFVFAKYRGLFCKTPPIVACEQHKDCVQCLAFGSGRYDEDECQAKCKKYNVTKVRSVTCSKSRFVYKSRMPVLQNKKVFE